MEWLKQILDWWRQPTKKSPEPEAIGQPTEAIASTREMSEYEKRVWGLWRTMSIAPARKSDVTYVGNLIIKHRDKYEAVEKACGVPWWFVGITHYMECNLDFTEHLANGDPLFDKAGRPLKTVRVPKGLGPYPGWIEAAIGALKHDNLTDVVRWDVVRALVRMEMYNGLGYRRMGVNSPYLWSFTNHYVRGKYASDGKYDPKLVSKQVGCAPLLKYLKVLGSDVKEVGPA